MKRIPASSTFPERPEIHADKTWHELGFNHKTTASMGMLIPLACKEVYPGELVKLQTEIKMRFAALYLPIMHQCYFTCDWYYVTNRQLWPVNNSEVGDGWEEFIKQDPITGPVGWPYFGYKQSDAVFTSGLLNYLGFNAPPPSGTLIAETDVSALPVSAYIKIYDEYYRNDQIQPAKWEPLVQGDNSTNLEAALPDLKVLRRNWPRDYYTSATPLPQQGANVLIPSYATDPITGDFEPQKLFLLNGGDPSDGQALGVTSDGTTPRYLGDGNNTYINLQLSSTIRDFRYAAQMTEYLERSMRAGDRYRDFVYSNFKWDPQPMFVDRPVWIGGYTGDVIISDVMATAKGTDVVVGDYAGKALASEITPVFSYTCPDYGLVMCLFTCYPKASYYSGLDNMWRRTSKMDYMWEQFAQIGDQPIRNKEVWFSWYDADIDWNEEIFGYLPQYAQWRYSNDIVSGQMRTIWEAFHLGRKFTAASQVVLNSDFITCTPDIGRCFVVDAEAGEHEIYIHAYNKISILRRLGRFGLPQL